MADSSREFGYSETFIREGNRNLALLFPLFVFVGGACVWYISDFTMEIEEAAVVAGIPITALGAVLAIEKALLNRRLRKLRVFIYDDKLVKQCGKKQHILMWNDIAGMKTIHKRSGAVFQINLYPNKPDIPMHLHGFRDMDGLAALIKERTPEGAKFHEKRWKLDWQNPLVSMLVAGVPTMVIMFVLLSMGNKAVVEILTILAALSFGLFLLASRPLTKSDIGFKWIELIVGVGMLVIGTYLLIRFL